MRHTHWDKPIQELVISGDWAFERYSVTSTDTPQLVAILCSALAGGLWLTTMPIACDESRGTRGGSEKSANAAYSKF